MFGYHVGRSFQIWKDGKLIGEIPLEQYPHLIACMAKEYASEQDRKAIERNQRGIRGGSAEPCFQNSLDE